MIHSIFDVDLIMDLGGSMPDLICTDHKYHMLRFRKRC